MENRHTTPVTKNPVRRSQICLIITIRTTRTSIVTLMARTRTLRISRAVRIRTRIRVRTRIGIRARIRSRIRTASFCA